MSTKPLGEGQSQEERTVNEELVKVEQEAFEEALEGLTNGTEDIQIPDISFMKDRKFVGTRTIKICSCGNPYCRSPEDLHSGYHWVDIEVAAEKE